MSFTPYVVNCDTHYQVCAHLKVGGGQWFWLAGTRWLPARRENVRHYSRFRSAEAAERAAQANMRITEQGQYCRCCRRNGDNPQCLIHGWPE